MESQAISSGFSVIFDLSLLSCTARDVLDYSGGSYLPNGAHESASEFEAER